MRRPRWGWSPDPVWKALAILIPILVSEWVIVMILFWKSYE